MSIESIVEALSQVRLPNVFNPYVDVCAIHDREDAAVVRRANLLEYLRAAKRLGSDTVWMGRDLGYRGGRRTGLALTDESHLSAICVVYGGKGATRATVGPALAERTAAEIWTIVRQIRRPPFLWNVFPFHPYEEGNQFSNRKFTAKELAVVDEINRTLFLALNIRRVVAIGLDAAHYCAKFDLELATVRHPSYGGVKDFRAGIRKLHPDCVNDSGLQARMF